MNRHLERSATPDSTVGDLLDDVLSAMDALVSRQRTSSRHRSFPCGFILPCRVGVAALGATMSFSAVALCAAAVVAGRRSFTAIASWAADVRAETARGAQQGTLERYASRTISGTRIMGRMSSSSSNLQKMTSISVH